MRLIAAIVLASATAWAQPTATSCGVTFVRAPDEARYEIERWLALEPHCSTSLSLRVVPTDGGLYLWAQRPDGRLHERVVPDARTAGVLVASWAADDWVDTAVPQPAVIAPIVSFAPTRDLARVDVPPRSRWHLGEGARWMTIGFVTSADKEQGGARAALDLFAYAGLRFGVSGQYGSGHIAGFQNSSPEQVVYPQVYGESMQFGGTHDTVIAATVSRAISSSGWELGASAGVGVLHTSTKLSWSTTSGSGNEEDSSITWPTAQASAMLTRHLNDKVALGFGPVVTYVDQTWSAPGVMDTTVRRGWQWLWNGALRIRM